MLYIRCLASADGGMTTLIAAGFHAALPTVNLPTTRRPMANAPIANAPTARALKALAPDGGAPNYKLSKISYMRHGITSTN